MNQNFLEGAFPGGGVQGGDSQLIDKLHGYIKSSVVCYVFSVVTLCYSVPSQ